VIVGIYLNLAMAPFWHKIGLLTWRADRVKYYITKSVMDVTVIMCILILSLHLIKILYIYTNKCVIKSLLWTLGAISIIMQTHALYVAVYSKHICIVN